MRNLISHLGNRLPAVVPVLALALVFAGCGDDGAGIGDNPQVRVLLTDAPADYIESAEIWVSAVYLQGGSMSDDDVDNDGIPDGEDEEVSGRVFLFEDDAAPKHFDLLELRDGVMEDLTGYTDVEPGQYGQLRLVVDSARVTLVAGYTFPDGSVTDVLRVPSGSTTGIKVQLSEPLELNESDQLTVVVDFDVDQNFRIQGNPDTPAGIQGVIFTPTLHELSRSQDD